MDKFTKTRYSLIAKLADRQDHLAWAEFLDLYQPLIYRFAIARGLQATDATEVTQEVLIRVAKVIGQFQANHSGPSFRKWLYVIARNLTIDFLRKESRKTATIGEEFDWQKLPAPSEKSSACFRTLYQREMFLAAARSIQPKVKPVNWQAFWLTEVDRLPVELVTQRLGIPRAAVYVARSRVLNMFRKFVQANQIPTSDSQSVEDRYEN